MADPFPPLHALHHPSDLAERLPTIICDAREQVPLPIGRLPTVRAGTLRYVCSLLSFAFCTFSG